MERRAEHRFLVERTVTLKALASRAVPEMVAFTVDISGRGMLLRTPLPMPCGVRVEVEEKQAVSRGAVCRCQPDPLSGYHIGLQISETIPVFKKRNCAGLAALRVFAASK